MNGATATMASTVETPTPSRESPEGSSFPGIVAEMVQRGPSSIITEGELAHLLRRHPASVRRAVRRRELPPPVRILGARVWTVGVLLRHLEMRLEEAAAEAERTARKVTGFGA